MKKILLFADPGVDDAFAIMYALLHPELEVVGIVCDYGNVSHSAACRNTSFLLKLADRKDIPIINGSSTPLSGVAPQLFPEIHGYKGIGGLDLTDVQSLYLHPFFKIYELIEQYELDLTIVNLSRLTSLAKLFMQMGSEMQQKVKDIIIMGGAFLVPGNWTPLAEANVYGDPQAARIVASMGKNMTFVPLNISNRAIISNGMIDRLSNHTQTPFTPILEPIMDFYSKKYNEIIPGIQGAPIHDVTLLSYLTDKSPFHVIQKQVFVVTEGPAKGMTFADFRPVPEMVSNYPVNQIILNFNVEQFQNDFMKVFSGFEP
ncbi:nucleoside hydrolase [Halobacillus mangrovi]|uniref:nucleoside hydrolase n=1 Tax=Halobacillus mangrovi TaxID=402384 RepID=UPI0018DC00D5|nr:nucleoside hydrolase [Halobacillus mangrovi]